MIPRLPSGRMKTGSQTLNCCLISSHPAVVPATGTRVIAFLFPQAEVLAALSPHRSFYRFLRSITHAKSNSRDLPPYLDILRGIT